jgi:hypothetical protein
MDKKKQAEKKISLNKLQMVKISNAKMIKGGFGIINLQEPKTGTGKTVSCTCE